MIEIKKNVPIPKRTGRPFGSGLKYPWLEMEVGDSFDTGSSNNKRSFTTMGAKVAAGAGRHMKFTQRVVGDTVMVWRVE